MAVHPEDLTRTLAVWRAAVAAGHPYTVEYRIRRYDGTYRWFIIRGERVRDSLGRDFAWVGTCTDIQEQKRAELAASAAQSAAVRALGLALEARDRETKGHTDRVTSAALRLGSALGLGEEEQEGLRLGAYLHDIGKIAVPDAVLLKPGPLTATEREVMQGHVQEGEKFALALGFLPKGAIALIRDHHERWDGSGYPARLSGEQISLLGRIFAVVDVYDALVSERPYKAAWPAERARQELAGQAGRQFDARVVEAFLALGG